MSADSAAISSAGLSKRFGRQQVVDGLDLEVPLGACYGFIGPNGSGKTTTIRMLLGLIGPDAGSCALLGEEMPGASAAVLPRVGALVEGPAFHPYLSGRANLERLDAADATSDPATARARIGTALDRVGLSAAAGKRYRAYSLGMRQRLGIAAALLQPRELLVLDEPTNGLDPQGTREVRHLVAELAADGTSVFVSSHLLAEVEQLCDHVGVMQAGRLVAQGPLADLEGLRARRFRLETPDTAAALETLAGLGVADAARTADGVVGSLAGLEPDRIVRVLVGAGVAVRGFSAVRPTLEEAFVELTGEGFDVSG
ncbi:MAG: ABC transporter ATP-binding protein [Propionicimonas sp.]|uniref:ABC transporter ATP-binding protein n=1 Tax=Propionicimonas sp. TaxID=1955623 RepID=UPI003D0DBFA0